jgi:hypothetical protein
MKTIGILVGLLVGLVSAPLLYNIKIRYPKQAAMMSGL